MNFVNRENWLRETLPPIGAYIVTGLAVTLVSVTMSNPSTSVGTLRPVETIPFKLFELALAGLGLGLIACITFRRLDLSLVLLSVAFVALLDIDHLPSVFGISQPIRPAHSVTFLVLVLAVLLTFTARKQPEIAVLAASGFLGHLAADTGIFAVFAPFSFSYTSLDPYKIPLALGAVACALFAGYLKRRRYLKDPGRTKKNLKEEQVEKTQTQSTWQ